jgi:UDP-glucose-4-epimerase GalE
VVLILYLGLIMRVLVTGGAGYIGSHAVRALKRAGHEVVILDNLSRGFRELARGFELIEADLLDPVAVAEAVAGSDAVMHFAALASVAESVEKPDIYFRNNMSGGMNLLNAARDAGVRYFVFSSTAAVYGMPERSPIPEETPREPINPYGSSKLFFEYALAAYDAAYGIRSARLRYFNAAGADESGEIGELHDPETHLIPVILQALTGKRKEVVIFGDDYPTQDGTCLRDYIHVQDLVDAHVLALEKLADGAESMSLNLGTGSGLTVREIVDAVERVTGKKVPVRIGARRPGDPPALVADPSRAEKLLGWKAKRGLDEIVSSAWKWAQKR